MAFFSDTSDRPSFIHTMMDKLGHFMDRLIIAQNRTETVEKLQALSDAELAEIGLSRDDIFRHVYRDIYYI
ncbi:DUF1127 domain-containing protein [Yoonia sp. BS5-3]|uniref:DUF1127 domain-containing protein n=1 Tax=Yoonia phaeophyticola TaxID=3137369 RepID=A0ABZ2V0Q5_9RHOB